MNADNSTISPVSIRLPCGEVIEIDGVPYEGWGYEPGKWYEVVQLDNNDIELWQRRWVIPA